jgi:hypothetical protein
VKPLYYTRLLGHLSAGDPMSEELVMIDSVPGMLEGEILRGLLESHGIDVMLSHESAGTAIGLSAGPLGLVELWVRSGQEAPARVILEQYRSGQVDPPG